MQFLGWRYSVIHLKLRLETFYGASVTPIGSIKVFKGNHGDNQVSCTRGTSRTLFWYFHKNSKFQGPNLDLFKLLNFYPRKMVLIFLQIGDVVLSDDISFVRIG